MSSFRRDTASIVHADLDCFFAAVEQRDQPELRGRPVAVGGGVVLAASYEARAFGVRGAMGCGEARRRCPDLVVVPPRMAAYSAASRDVFAVFDDTTPDVEAVSIDEAFLDVGGLARLSGPPPAIAARLRHDVRERVGLPISVGVARTKFLAKVASRTAKPDGLVVVPPDRETAFLHPLPVEHMWGVGHVTAEKLHRRGIVRVADLAAVPERALAAFLGAHTAHVLRSLALHDDPRPVRPRRRRRTIGAQRSFGSRRASDADADAAVVALVDRVTRRLRDADRSARTVVLRLRFADFTRATRSHSLPHRTSDTAVLLATARHLLSEAAPIVDDRGLTLVGIALANLGPTDALQLELPFARRERAALDRALDEIRTRFGPDALGRAVHLDRPPGEAMAMLPD